MANLRESLLRWWGSISLREQRLVMICSVLLTIGAIYWLVLQPVAQRAEMAQTRIQSEKQLLSWVKNQANQIVELRAQGGRSVSSLPLNQAVSSSARRYNVELVRVQPRGKELQVWVQPLPFNQFLNWVADMQENHGVNVMFLDIDKADRDGMVEVKRLQLSKG
ncbi:type II secretion system protein M [Vibrio sinensis]|uniref:Type II secretion system protein M n=1 Tax=Vibrio sinensis TaxID=2302434 RepID=A0A3A6QIR9_9VIBR|nr:type II secretion system protein M [Vibrio sinensis]RJX72435.1 type II secretion system protein M [Vibrio sinensis]